MTVTKRRNGPEDHQAAHATQHEVDYSPYTSPIDPVMEALNQRHPGLGETLHHAMKDTKAAEAPWLNGQEVTIEATVDNPLTTYRLDPTSTAKAVLEAFQTTYPDNTDDAHLAAAMMAHRMAEPVRHELSQLPNPSESWHPSMTIKELTRHTTRQLAEALASHHEGDTAEALNNFTWLNQDIQTAWKTMSRNEGPETKAVHDAIDTTSAILEGASTWEDSASDPRNLYQAMNDHLTRWSPIYAAEAAQAMAHAISAPITYRVVQDTHHSNYAGNFQHNHVDNPEQLSQMLQASAKLIQHRTLSATDQMAYHAVNGNEDAFATAFHRLTSTTEAAKSLSDGFTQWPDADDYDWEMGFLSKDRPCMQLTFNNAERAETLAVQFMQQMAPHTGHPGGDFSHQDYMTALQHPQAPETFGQMAEGRPNGDKDLLVDQLALKTADQDIIADQSFPQHKARTWQTLTTQA